MYLGVDVRFRRSFLCHTSVIARGEAGRARGEWGGSGSWKDIVQFQDSIWKMVSLKLSLPQKHANEGFDHLLQSPGSRLEELCLLNTSLEGVLFFTQRNAESVGSEAQEASPSRGGERRSAPATDPLFAPHRLCLDECRATHLMMSSMG